MTYYVITRNGVALAVALTNAYELGLADVSIHEFEGMLPDLNTHTWDSAAEQFVPSDSKLTRLGFMSRFTTDERIAIRTSTDPIVFDIMNLLDHAEYIDTADQKTIMGVNYIASVGLLAGGRVTEILS